MRTISKSRLKAGMLGIFRDIERSGEALVVTDHGQPVLKIVPLKPRKARIDQVFAGHRGKVIYRGDIMEPLTDEWDDLPR
jgi:antitoxin (DNA-binding transcriptional repressor) of toxin-antitoxin stability system